MWLLFAMVLTLPEAMLNRPYEPAAEWVGVSGQCGMPVARMRLLSGTLPAGLTMTEQGRLRGTPSEPGEFVFQVEVSDGCLRRVETRRLHVRPAPILLAEAEVAEFRCMEGAAPFDGGVVRISGSTPGSGYAVDVQTGSEWLTATARDGMLPAEGSALDAEVLRLRIAPGKLAPGVHTARLRFSTWRGVQAPELEFHLHVLPRKSELKPFAMAPPPPAPRPLIVMAPETVVIVPPRVRRPQPPIFPKAQPRKPADPPKPRGRYVPRSRVLPIPRVMALPPAPPPASSKPAAVIPNKPAVSPAKPPDAMAKPTAPMAKQAPPERTKPSAMPPPKAAAKDAH
jgi:hypothetical protein